MNKHEWWSALTPLEKALVRELPNLCGEIFETFGPFTVESIEYTGVEVFTETPWTNRGYWSNE